MTRRSIVFSISLVLLAFVSTSVAQELPLQYAIKFVCGKTDRVGVAPGNYFTMVNVHNPGREPAVFLKKFAVAFPEQKPGPVTERFKADLKPDFAFAVECREIMERTHSSGFVEGFMVIESKVELDVVAVYTTVGASGGQIQTMELERVPVRRVP